DLPTILKAWQEYCTSQKMPGAPDIYIADVAANLATDGNGHRLDFQYHHPARRTSQDLIARSSYPIKRLGDICAERNVTIVPAKELADTVIPYTGLANIEAETGIAEQAATPANSLKSAVKVYQRGDIVFAKMRPNLRKVALMDFGESGY